jgi:hypothetical protein
VPVPSPERPVTETLPKALPPVGRPCVMKAERGFVLEIGRASEVLSRCCDSWIPPPVSKEIN